MARKRGQKGWSEGSEKSFLCILSYKKTRHRGGGESNVSMNPGMPFLVYPLRGITAWYIDIVSTVVTYFGELLNHLARHRSKPRSCKLAIPVRAEGWESYPIL